MIVDKLVENILIKPLKQYNVNRLCILSGYATPNMASWYMKNLRGYCNEQVEVSLIVGMVPFDGLSVAVHEGFQELVKAELPKEIKHFQCSYVFENEPVHSKVYIWLRDEEPVIAFTGSANFTQSSFGDNRREVMQECDANEAYSYYCLIEGETIFCNHSEVEEYIILHATHPILDIDNNLKSNLSGSGVEKVTLTLLNSRTGDIHKKAGLNWGHRTAKSTLKSGDVVHRPRNRNEAYIPLPASIARTGFFPLQQHHFSVITDDKHQLILRVEQEKDKAITTPLSNAQLGEYFRNRLGLANGQFVTKADLERYGRTDVTFYKFDDEQYYLDFSI